MVARKGAASSKGKEIVQEPDRELFPTEKKRKLCAIAAEGSKPKKSGVLQMKSEAKGAAIGEGTSTESVQATYALVKQLSDQNQMMQNMLNSVTQLCTTLQESHRRVEAKEEEEEEEQEEAEEEDNEEDVSENLEEEQDDGTENDSGDD
ncbi:uncharacterized protein LOC125493147 [Beta vulgaris subsp. vulgaris]|uniref:uncharacterized protein LOC125493147 n=1 Tax=Beta vulgaris subsp. vulgaris TaxID=3555 RepID=UPI002036CA61|nr:uncharacterized protein LOC125493147 [Beta vulgaris subsp. vulgaris]